MEVTPAREYRTVVSNLGAGQGGYLQGDMSPDGRLLSVNMAEGGVFLWRLPTGRQVAVLPAGLPLFQPGGRELLIANRDGLHRPSIVVGQIPMRSGPESHAASSEEMESRLLNIAGEKIEFEKGYVKNWFS